MEAKGDKGQAETNRTPRKRRPQGDEVGSALRAAYRSAVDEDVPQEMLDLLGKLS